VNAVIMGAVLTEIVVRILQRTGPPEERLPSSPSLSVGGAEE
jgi:hypothetical protein